ncbi:MAG: IS630 family transposase [Paludibacteraceae bacterium]|nr:IS630 family transposase [Paludibacteraceae bacterium]
MIEQEDLDKSKVILMTQDEGRFGRVNISRNCWAPKQIRPLVAKQVVRESFYVYAGICPKLGRISSLILPYANTEMMNLFLENVSEEYKDFEVIMQLDGAGWHKAKGLKIPSNIHFLQQPPYSPEVNPTEHLWDEIREKYLHNKIFDSLAETMEAVCRGINELNAKPEYVKSMTLFLYLNIIF